MEENNKRILKNTIYLYIRQFVIMALAFVSTRIVLDKLGVEDYGIYNVVGGFVALFTVLNNVFQSATRRFLALAIGKGSTDDIKRTFATSLFMHILIALIVFLALESAGVWLLNTVLNIAPDRMNAANWVFQFSVLNVMVSITQTPYTAAVTAHEQFNVYAAMSIYDVVAKILILFLLVYLPFDKLIVYAALMFVVSATGCLIYRFYCRHRFVECRLTKTAIDRSLFKEMLKFSGWDSLGNVMGIANQQGTTLMLNVFFNTAVNASRGIAGTITSTVSQFVSGFIVAAEPQLTKYYAQHDKVRFEKLIFNVSQMTLFMLALFAVPIWLELEYVIQLWLGQIPEYTPEFVKISILVSFITYSNNMLLKGNVAIGRVKEISLYMAPISLLPLLLVYIVLKLGWSPLAVYFVGVVPTTLRLFIDLYILKKFADFPSTKYFFNIFIKNVLLVLLACIPPLIIQKQMEGGFIRFVVVCSMAVVSTIGMLWVFGLNKDTKMMIMHKIFKKKYNNAV